MQEAPPKPPFVRNLKLRDEGPDVVAVKRALVRWNHGVRAGIVINPTLGVAADNQIKAFQKRAGLHVDGVYGPATHAALAPYFDSYGGWLLGKEAAALAEETLGLKALAEARKYLGLHETPPGSNEQQFGAWYGLDGQPWCAIFVTYVLVKVGAKGWERGTFTASVAAISLAAAGAQRGLSFTTDPKPGDLVLYGTSEHVEFFEHWVDRSNGIFQALGGNTSSGDGSYSSGGEVASKPRHVAGTTSQKPVRFASVS